MELKEIWEHEIKDRLNGSAASRGAQHIFENGFLSGCQFENDRSHWFDPEKVLPPRSENGRSSEPVLCKIAGGHIKVYRYDYAKNEWRSLGGQGYFMGIYTKMISYDS